MPSPWLGVLVVGAGGFLGAASRHGLALLLHRLPGGATFPYGTLGVNLLGCLTIGVLAGLVETRDILSPDARLFLFVGLLGGFTTFSAFGLETIQLLRAEHLGLSVLNGVVQVVGGLLAVWVGMSAVRWI